MYGIEGINFIVLKFKYFRILALLVITVFSNTAFSGFAVFTTSESSLEGASARYFSSQAKDLLDIPSSEINTIFDPYLMDFEDVLFDLAKRNSKGSSHLIYLALPTSFSENELAFDFDGELVGLREIYSTIGQLQGDYLLVVETEQWPSSQLRWPSMPNNISLIGAVSSSNLLDSNNSLKDLPYASDLSILFFQELIRAESGQIVSAKTLTTRLVREFKENRLLYFSKGKGSNATLPSFVPKRGSYYYEKLTAEIESEARNAKKAQLAREAEAQIREQKQDQNTANAKPPLTSPSTNDASEPNLGEALALIEKMKAEAAEKEKQLKAASEEIKKKRKNTTSFGF